MNWSAEPLWQWWCQEVEIPRAQQRAETAEAARDKTGTEVERLQRLYRAAKANIRLPWQNHYPLP